MTDGRRKHRILHVQGQFGVPLLDSDFDALDERLVPDLPELMVTRCDGGEFVAHLHPRKFDDDEER